MFSTRLMAYFFATCGRQVLNRLEAAQRALGGPLPISKEVWMSIINR